MRFVGDAVETGRLRRAFEDHKSGKVVHGPPPQLAHLYRWNTHVLARVKSTQKNLECGRHLARCVGGRGEGKRSCKCGGAGGWRGGKVVATEAFIRFEKSWYAISATSCSHSSLGSPKCIMGGECFIFNCSIRTVSVSSRTTLAESISRSSNTSHRCSWK